MAQHVFRTAPTCLFFQLLPRRLRRKKTSKCQKAIVFCSSCVGVLFYFLIVSIITLIMNIGLDRTALGCEKVESCCGQQDGRRKLVNRHRPLRLLLTRGGGYLSSIAVVASARPLFILFLTTTNLTSSPTKSKNWLVSQHFVGNAGH